jgi:mitochondrial fission protein ELM1
MNKPLTCWALTEGFAGMENQCLGLAEALGLHCHLKRVQRPRPPINYLPPRFWPTSLSMISSGCEVWPDVLISSGRGSVAPALAVRRANGGRTFTVHIQTPYVSPSEFDLVVIPQHDTLRGENVLVTQTALHRVTRERLAQAAEQFKHLFLDLPRPLIAVLVGGSNKRQNCSPEVMHHMADLLIAAASDCGGGLAVTTSRRTGEQNEKILRDRLQILPLFFWDGSEENPYMALLALADAIVVTSDSVSMVSEACATGKPVHVFSIGGDYKKLRAFHSRLQAEGATRPFNGYVEQWSYEPLRETEKIAQIVQEHLYRVSTNSQRPLCQNR